VESCADNADPSTDQQAGEREVAQAVEAFQRATDSETACSLLTEDGQRYVVENFGSGKFGNCEDFPSSGEASSEPPPKVAPVGVSGDFALAVVQFGGETDESFVYTLKRVDGNWLIDCPCVVPNPDQIELGESDEAKDYANSAKGLEAAGQEETDGDFDPVIAVGDVALAYQSDGGSAPTLLVNDGNGWRVAPISVGAY
jgi:hypothetical protein